MRNLFLITILFFLLFVNLAVADPDSTYWASVNQYKLNVGDSFSVGDYNITMTDRTVKDLSVNSILMKVSDGKLDKFEIMELGDTIFVADDSIQFTFESTNYDGSQTINVWRERTPSVGVMSVITKIENTSYYNADFTLRDDNGAGEADDIVVILTLPVGCTINTTKPIFDNVNLTATVSATNSVKIYWNDAISDKKIIANVKYTYNGRTKDGSFSKPLFLPANDTVASVTTIISDVVGFQNVVSTVTRAPITTATIVSTPISTTTTTSVNTAKNVTSVTGVQTLSVQTTTQTTTTPTKPKADTSQMHVVKFKAHAPAPPPPPPKQVTNSTNTQPQPLSIPKMSDIQITKNDKGAALLCTLLFGWFIIYKI